METITRPVWRGFAQTQLLSAHAHARAGGIAVVRGPTRWSVLTPAPDGDIPELCFWALMDLGVKSPRIHPEGLASAPLSEGMKTLARRWMKRDKALPDATTEVALDCMACGACCRRNKVILDEDDFTRWRDVGRYDLCEKPYVRRQRGRALLVLHDNGDCLHLQGNACGIYLVRPDNCRAFPAGCEPCLSARLEDGVDAG